MHTLVRPAGGGKWFLGTGPCASPPEHSSATSSPRGTKPETQTLPCLVPVPPRMEHQVMRPGSSPVPRRAVDPRAGAIGRSWRRPLRRLSPPSAARSAVMLGASTP